MSDDENTNLELLNEEELEQQIEVQEENESYEEDNYLEEGEIVGEEREEESVLKKLLNTDREEREPIYIMTLELDGGRSENIKIYNDSNPNELAFKFCKHNDLDFNAMNYLKAEIENLIIKNSENRTEETNNNLAESQMRNEAITELEEEQDLTDKNKGDTSKNVSQNNADKSKVSKDISYNKSDVIEDYSTNKVFKDSIDMDDSNIPKADNTSHSVNKLEDFYGEEKKSLLDMTENINLDISDGSKIQDKLEKTEKIDLKNLNHFDNLTYKFKINSSQSKSVNVNTSNINDINELNDISSRKDKSQIQLTCNLEEDNNHLSHTKINTEKFSSVSKNNQAQNNNTNQPHNQNQLNNSSQHEQENEEEVEVTSNSVIITNHECIDPNNPFNKQTFFPKSSFTNKHKIPSSSNTNNLPHNKIKYSKLINNNSNSRSTMPIHERLFREAEIKRKLPFQIKNSFRQINSTSSWERESTKKSISKSNVNYGEILYYRGKLLNEEKMRKIAHKRAEKETEESPSFHPTISHYFPSHLNNLNRSNYHNRDYRIIKSLNDKLTDEEEKEENNHKNKNSYVSHPILNSVINSEKSAQRKIIKLEKLRNEINSQFTFKPEIVSYQSTYQSTNPHSPENLYRRGLCNKDHNHNFDSEMSFKPNLIARNNIQREDPFSVNYNWAERYEEKKEHLKRIYQDEYKNFNISKFYDGNNHSSNRSELVHSETKTRAFRRIFKALDTDEDNYITIQSVNIKNIPGRIRTIIDPIISELKEENENLNEEEFVRAMDHLYNMLSYNERRTLIKEGINSIGKSKSASYGINTSQGTQLNGSSSRKSNTEMKSKNNPTQFEFKPTINENSRKIDKKLNNSLNAKKLNNEPIESKEFFRLTTLNYPSQIERLHNITFKNYKSGSKIGSSTC